MTYHIHMQSDFNFDVLFFTLGLNYVPYCILITVIADCDRGYCTGPKIQGPLVTLLISMLWWQLLSSHPQPYVNALLVGPSVVKYVQHS